jgi:hypothetical protein
MLDQHWRGFSSDIDDLTDDDLNAAVAAIASVSLKRFAPAPVEQRSDSGHARCWRRILGARDASQYLDAHLRVRTRQRAQIGWDFLAGQGFTGWVYPLLLAARRTITQKGAHPADRRRGLRVLRRLLSGNLHAAPAPRRMRSRPLTTTSRPMQFAGSSRNVGPNFPNRAKSARHFCSRRWRASLHRNLEGRLYRGSAGEMASN